MESDGFVATFLASLAKHLAIPKVPRIDQDAMRRELFQALTRVETPSHVPASVENGTDLQEEVVNVLARISQWPAGKPDVQDLANGFEVSKERMKYYLDILTERELIHYSVYINRPATYYLTKEGRRFLVERGLL